MTTTPPETPPQAPHDPPGPDAGPRVAWDDIRDLGRIRRDPVDSRIAGVSAGLAHHLDIDPVIVRVAFVVLTFFGGVGLLLYIACWLLIPQEGSDWAKVALDRRSRGVALAAVGVLAVILLIGHGWWGTGVPWPLLIVAAAVTIVATQLPSRRDRSTAARPPQPGTPGTPGAPGAPGVTDAPTYGTSSYAAPSYDAAQGGTAPSTSTYAYTEQPRPVNPRRRGPILFWFTLALMAVGLGSLGIADLAGANVATSAYPALVLALSGVALLVGAFFGRAGGLILVGLLAWAVTAGTTVADHWDVHRTVERPAAVADVRATYRIDVGELVVDLAQVSDPAQLDGRTVHVDGNVGHLDIRVPPGVNVIAHLDINGPGGISAFGQDVGGLGHTLNTRYHVSAKAPTITIDAQLDVGAIDLHTEAAR